ncbi:MAG: hypothetical protein JXN64_13520 [Spirochaetes bacterium]|nr:hypothetical protein [Spirochaetota bacterium]
MSKHIKTIIIIFFIGCMLSCATTPVSVTSSNTPLNEKRIAENLGKVEGVSFPCYSIFGIWMLGWPDIQSAIDSALAENGADALINIKCYEKWTYFLFFSITTVIVEGEAVTFQKPGGQYVEPY